MYLGTLAQRRLRPPTPTTQWMHAPAFQGRGSPEKRILDPAKHSRPVDAMAGPSPTSVSAPVLLPLRSPVAFLPSLAHGAAGASAPAFPRSLTKPSLSLPVPSGCEPGSDSALCLLPPIARRLSLAGMPIQIVFLPVSKGQCRDDETLNLRFAFWSLPPLSFRT